MGRTGIFLNWYERIGNRSAGEWNEINGNKMKWNAMKWFDMIEWKKKANEVYVMKVSERKWKKMRVNGENWTKIWWNKSTGTEMKRHERKRNEL